MKTTIFYDSVLIAIEKLYLKFAIKVLHKRMNSYHKLLSRTTAINTAAIESPLLGCIEEIIDIGEKKLHTNASIDYSLLSKNICNPHQPVEPHEISHHFIDRENISELSRYFKQRKNGSELNPKIEERLTHSTWSHIHEAIRYARKGDNPNARMHTTIANNACMELAHYMLEDNYLAFITKIKEHLNNQI